MHGGRSNNPRIPLWILTFPSSKKSAAPKDAPMLILPQRHVAVIWDLEAAEYAACFELARAGGKRC